jgi:hypothetical protein
VWPDRPQERRVREPHRPRAVVTAAVATVAVVTVLPQPAWNCRWMVRRCMVWPCMVRTGRLTGALLRTPPTRRAVRLGRLPRPPAPPRARPAGRSACRGRCDAALRCYDDPAVIDGAGRGGRRLARAATSPATAPRSPTVSHADPKHPNLQVVERFFAAYAAKEWARCARRSAPGRRVADPGSPPALGPKQASTRCWPSSTSSRRPT